jgi:hypothetical protein
MSRIRKPGGAGADALPKRKRKQSKIKLPAMFRGMFAKQEPGLESLNVEGLRRISAAIREGGEARGYLQEQLEWLRKWIAEERIEPKDACTAMRGLSKVLEQIEGRLEADPVSVVINMGPAPPVTTGDILQIH